MSLDCKLFDIEWYKVSYGCDSQVDTVVYVVGEDNSRFSPNPKFRLFCGSRSETLIKKYELIPDIGSLWMIRSLAATNDINASYIGLPLNRDDRPYYFLRDADEQYSKKLEHYPLIWSVLNTKKFIEPMDRLEIGQLLDSAPACGPYNLLYTNSAGTEYYDWTVLNWSCPNRLMWPELNGTGGTDINGWKRHGYFNGIDYMLLHNLYWLTRLKQTEYNADYVDPDPEISWPVSPTTESIYLYGRNTVTLKPGAKISNSTDLKCVVGTNPNMRTSYDPSNIFYHKINVDTYESDCECETIFRGEDQFTSLKSGFVSNVEESIKIEDICISIFPNPATDMVRIESNETLQNIQLTDASGIVYLKATNLSSKKHNLNVSNLSSGIYFIRLTTDNGYESIQKFIKKK